MSIPLPAQSELHFYILWENVITSPCTERISSTGYRNRAQRSGSDLYFSTLSHTYKGTPLAGCRNGTQFIRIELCFSILLKQFSSPHQTALSASPQGQEAACNILIDFLRKLTERIANDDQMVPGHLATSQLSVIRLPSNWLWSHDHWGHWKCFMSHKAPFS